MKSKAHKTGISFVWIRFALGWVTKRERQKGACICIFIGCHLSGTISCCIKQEVSIFRDERILPLPVNIVRPERIYCHL